jgi:hypothetical protein
MASDYIDVYKRLVGNDLDRTPPDMSTPQPALVTA